MARRDWSACLPDLTTFSHAGDRGITIFRLATIIATSIRFGLDEILLRAFAPRWLLYSWLTLMFWRPLVRPRGVRLRAALDHLGPLFVKFGQVLSTRQDIVAVDIAAELSELQDKVKPQPFLQIKAEIEKSYGRPANEIFEEIDHEPIGSASVAQVHRGVLLDGTTVAIKVLRPNISQHVQRDIKLMMSFAWLLETCHREGSRLRPRALVEEFHRSLKGEIDLLHEAANCNQLRRNFDGSDKIRIPKVHWEHCTKNVMVMELLEGVPVDQIDDLRDAGIDLDKLARTGIEIFFTQVFRDSFFHADMHPGNLLIDAEGRFVVLDYGIMGSLSDSDKDYIGANFLAFFNRDYRRVARMHIEAGWVPGDTSVPQFEDAIRAVCEPIFSRPLKDISFGRLLLQLFQVARRFNLSVQPQLILLQKTLLNIEGLGRQLAPELNLWDSAKPFLEDWGREQQSPRRVAELLRETAPSLIALLPDLPQAAKASMQRNQLEYQRLLDERGDLRKSRERWRIVALALVLATLWNLLV